MWGHLVLWGGRGEGGSSLTSTNLNCGDWLSPNVIFLLEEADPGGSNIERTSHLDVVGVSDQLVDVRRLRAQPGRVVLQDDAFASTAVQAVGRPPVSST